MLLDECPENLGLIPGNGKDFLFTAVFFMYSFSKSCVYSQIICVRLSNYTSHCFWCQCCHVYNNIVAAYFEFQSYHLFLYWLTLQLNTEQTQTLICLMSNNISFIFCILTAFQFIILYAHIHSTDRNSCREVL